MDLTAFALNCSLKPGTEPSSTALLLDEVMAALGEHGVRSDGVARVVDHDVRPGVRSDEGDGDEWPALRERLLAADIVVLGTPIWLGHPSSVCQRVLERMDAFLSETDDEGRLVTWGKVAVVAVVGNEDGAHHVAAELYQGLNDVGFSLAPSASTFWVGEAMHGTDYKDLPNGSEETDGATAGAAANAAHLARLLKGSPFPPPE